MSSVAACVVPNKSNEGENLGVLTKWTEDDVTFLIVRHDRTYVVGKVALNNFNTYAEHFEKTLKDYVEETRDILLGNKHDVDFNLQDSKFFWKRKKWLLGQVTVKSTNKIDHLLDFVSIQIDQMSKVNKKNAEQEKLIESLEKSNSDMVYKMNQVILLKEQMETEWYRVFLLMINAKKAKIRELKMENERLKKIISKDVVYDASTDESENETDAKNDVTSQSVLVKRSASKRLREESARSSRTVVSEKRPKIQNENGFIVSKEEQLTNGKDTEAEARITEINKTSEEHKEVDECDKVIELRKDTVGYKKFEKVKNKSTRVSVEKEKSPQNPATRKNSKKMTESEIDSNNESQMKMTEIDKQNTVPRKGDDFVETSKVGEEKTTSQVDVEPVPSTSKSAIIPSTNLVQEENNVPRVDGELVGSTTKSLLSTIGEDEETPDILSDESDCEMELKLEEDKDDNCEEGDDKNTEKNLEEDKSSEYGKIEDAKITIVEQDSEEMVF